MDGGIGWECATNQEIHAYWDLYRRRVLNNPKSAIDLKVFEAIEAEIQKRNPGFYSD